MNTKTSAQKSGWKGVQIKKAAPVFIYHSPQQGENRAAFKGNYIGGQT